MVSSNLQRLDQQFLWRKVYIQSELQRLMGVLEARLELLEAVKADWEEAVDNIAGVGLARVNEVLGPLLTQLQQASNLGFLVASASSQTNTMVLNQPFGLTLDSEGHEMFTPTPWLTIMDVSDPDNWGIGELQTYTASTGDLTVTMKYVSGGTEGSNWTVACSNAMMPAMNQILVDANAAQDAAEAAVATVNAAMSTLQGLIEAIEEGPVASVNNYTGAVMLAVADIVGLTDALAAKAATTYVNTQVGAKQDSSAKLSAIANAAWADNKFLVLTGAATLTPQSITDFGKSLVATANAAAGRTLLEVPSLTFATDAEIRAASGDGAIKASSIESASAPVTLTDATTIALNWDAGINFDVTLTANRILGNPTNGQPRTTRTVLVKGSTTTDRTLSFGNQYLGTLPVIVDVDNTRWYLLTIFCISSTHFVVTSVKAYGT
jgi:hypothetical protein